MIYLWETHAAFYFIVCLPSHPINFSSKNCSSLARYLACEERVSDGMDHFLNERDFIFHSFIILNESS